MEGLYITDLMGLTLPTRYPGIFPRVLADYKGRLTYPVRGLTVAGNMIVTLQNIDAVGTEVQFSAAGAPSPWVSSLSVAGS